MKTMDNVKRRIITSMVAILLLVITIFGITYAYFISNVKGNPSDKSISVSAGILELTYMDGNGVLDLYKYLIPGEPVTFKDKDGKEVREKTFSVENTGTKLIDDYEVVLQNLVNELEYYEDLTYTLTCKSSIEDKKCNGSNGVFPKTNGILVENSIESEEIHYYTLKLEYHETNKDQSKDMNKNISAKINIQDNESELKGLIVYGNSVQDGTPSADNPIEIKSVGEKTGNIFDCSAITANDHKLQGIVLSNNYGTTINSTKYTGEIIVNQSNYSNADNESHYQNGFFSIGLNGLEVGKTYTLIYDYDILSNPLNTDKQTLIHGNTWMSPILENNRAKVVFEWQNDTYNSIEFRLYGRSMKYSNFMLIEGEIEGFPEYEPNGYKIPLTVSSANLINVNDLNYFEKQSDGAYKSNVVIQENYTLIENLKGVHTFSIKIKSPLETDYRLRVDYVDDTYTEQYKKSTGNYVQFSFTTNGKDIKRAYFTYNISSNQVTFKDFQIEQGNTTTEYTRYFNEIYNIYLDEPLRKVGDVADYIDFTNYRLVRYIKEIDNTGTKSISDSYEVLDLPIQENINLPMIVKENISEIKIGTSIQPSKMEY